LSGDKEVCRLSKKMVTSSARLIFASHFLIMQFKKNGQI
jgi:hypothetical protein